MEWDGILNLVTAYGGLVIKSPELKVKITNCTFINKGITILGWYL